MKRLAAPFRDRLHVLLAPQYDGRDADRFAGIAAQATALGLPLVASAAPVMHHARRRRMADVLTAIRTGRRVDDLGRDARANGEQRLRSGAEMARIFARYPQAVENALRIAEDLHFSLDMLRYEYPSETLEGETPDARLARLSEEGLRWRYPSGVPQRVRDLLDHELRLIGKLGYAPYFLTVHDVVAFARSRGIL